MKEPEDKFVEIALIVCVCAVIILKLTGILPISWVIITAVLWIPLIIGTIFVVAAIIIMIVQNLLEYIKEKKDGRN